MGNPVLFLDGELEGQMVFGIPNHSEYKRVLSMDETRAYHWCGDEECCEPPDEPWTETYFLTDLGHSVRAATTKQEDIGNRDKLAFRLAEMTYKLWTCSPMAQHPRWKQQKVTP